MSTPANQPDPTSAPGAGTAARVEQLYESHAARVRSICRSLLRDRVEAEDAVQQTFLSAQRALLNGSSPRDPAAWLATIARHESLARVRTRMREPLPLDTDAEGAGPDAHAAAVSREKVSELRDALADLPPQQRDALLLREVRGLSYDEVASALSVTTAAVESLLFRARRSLQSQLREALAAVAPGAWMQPLRELAEKLLGGGLLAPAASKIAAVGVGTAVVAGGVAVDPAVIGLGHGPTPARTAAASAPAHRPAAVTPSASPAPPKIWTPPAHGRAPVVLDVQRETGDRSAGGRSGAGREVTDRRTSSTGGAPEPADAPTTTAAGEQQPTSGYPVESGSGGGEKEYSTTDGSGGSDGTRTTTATSTTGTTTTARRDD